MAYVDGVVLDKPEVLGRLTPDDAARACELLVDTLLALHAIDPPTSGSRSSAGPHGFLERQVRRWRSQWEASETEPRAGLEELVAGLADRIPPEQPRRHRARRLPARQRRSTATTSTASPPSSTGRWPRSATRSPTSACSSSTGRSASRAMFGAAPMSTEAGFLTPDALVQRYAAGTSRDLAALPWYVAFGVLQARGHRRGHPCRYLQGKTVGDGLRRPRRLRAPPARRLAAVARPPLIPQHRPAAPRRDARWTSGTATDRSRCRSRCARSSTSTSTPPSTRSRSRRPRSRAARHAVPHAGGARRPQGRGAQPGPVEPVPAGRRARRRPVGAGVRADRRAVRPVRAHRARGDELRAPDTGNMELLHMFGTPEQQRAVARAAARRRDPLVLLDDRARRRVVRRHQHRRPDHRGRRRVRRQRPQVVVDRRDATRVRDRRS